MNNEFQRSDNNNGNKVKIVIITILVMIVLGLAAFLVLNNSTSKDNNVTNNENNNATNNATNNENNSNNASEVVTLDINSKQVKDITKLITNNSGDGEYYYDDALFGALDLNNSSRYDFMMLLTSSQLDADTTCAFVWDEEKCRDAMLVIDDNNSYNFYVNQKDMEDKFKEIFGPDVTFSHKSFDNSYCSIPEFYDSKTKRYWGNAACGGGFAFLPGTVFDLYKAEQKDDEIYTYWYTYEIHVNDNDDGVTYFIKNLDSGTFVSDALSDYEKIEKEAEKLETEGKINTYKITYKKQSDGNYYIYSGEWL